MNDTDVLRRLATARELIDDKFAEALSLQRIAREAHLSPFHFHRLFRHIFELTPHQYMTRRRMERARELLVYTDMPVSEICYQVGFQSLGSFSSTFHRHTGLSPRGYRDRFGRSTLLIGVLHPNRSALYIPYCFLSMHGTSP